MTEKEKSEKKFLEELKRRNGGIDFKKYPPTEREMYECAKKIGYVNLAKIAYDRRRIIVRR